MANDAPIMYGLAFSFLLPLIEPPIITGNRGKTQGARIVSIPAIKLISKSSIFKIKYKSMMVVMDAIKAHHVSTLPELSGS